ncbi:pseudouridine-5'-phosphatase-like isoform X1 [Leguminivora glycinivorella]|uniref:pseudouridine-5'-phosphatase-like isoform X1 n=1 Tax=Leguminivora glycinivorella TaxID=1035111 RepID=UPI0020106196|nr:pseudouridine-5'-phosphatase-like isoform X1 [Leguminivora glycinivorella]
MAFKKVSHVLFDLDGLLIDSEILYTQAFTNVCAKYGKEFTWELKSSLLGFQGHECAEKIITTLELPVTKQDFMKLCQKEYEVLFPKVQLMPGAQRLVEHLHSKGVPIALATSSAQDSVDLKMKNFQELLGLFHHLTMGSTDPEVTKGKPDPAIFLVCASRFPDKPKPEDCLVFEDAVNGVKAANAANMQVVAVPDPRIDPALLNTATLVLNLLEEFKPELFGLPAFD